MVRLPSARIAVAGQAEPGLFVAGRAAAGRPLCLYPGLLHEPGAPAAALAAWRNAYVMRLQDGTLLDGRYYGLSRWLFRGALRRAGPQAAEQLDAAWLERPWRPGQPWGADPLAETLLTAPSPWALGCLVNHFGALGPAAAPAAELPNVTYLEAAVPLPGALASALPYVFHDGRVPCSPGGEAGPGSARVVALVALRDVEDEELLADYSFVARLPA